MTAKIEREKKYLISQSAKWRVVKHCTGEPEYVRQGYLLVMGEIELRVCSSQLGHAFSIKWGHGERRTEFEKAITEDEANQLWEMARDGYVRKQRYTYGRWEFDIFTRPDGLILAEIELDSEEEAPEFPEWLVGCVIREVTDEYTYKNQALAKLAESFPFKARNK